ncbi:hypothetical protein CN378_21675 [Bacillus sp. AFS015802]|uniref:hypothetical protein n=1 Tax=Bacillus sp. AFS015802 TaxID=2033486 RepID=UPI000BF984EE|nr:hypothetical protein [Bacillus sp. AFS015802]PFA62217.1 hypothetical protein CN378_21675 [Bacillus sp. AFS015802]
MKTQTLLYYIGAFIFAGLGVLTFLQLHKAKYQIEAGTFIVIAALIYYGMVNLFFKGSRKTFLLANTLLAILALGGIFFNSMIFGGH